MQLTDLIETDQQADILGVTSDSRQVKKGFLFAALPGSKAKGSDFIQDAILHGAIAILLDEESVLSDDIEAQELIILRSKNVRQDFAKIVSKFYKIQPEKIVAVTGTSGKTSVVSFTQQLWHLSGIVKCASLGTLGLRAPGMQRYGRLTTPGTQEIHADLADLAAGGITHFAMEASSHGLDQHRLDGVNIMAAGYTNLSRDHLDYHEDMEAYFKVKSRLFSELLSQDGMAVLNTDDAYFSQLEKICLEAGHKVLSYGQKGKDLKLVSRTSKPQGQDIVVEVQGKKYDVTLPLVGEFQVMNALCALGLVLAVGGQADEFVPLLEKLQGVSGRLEFVSGHKVAAVYVDYAHKPAALEAVLKTLRSHTEGKLYCVFGCGGNRDVGKRFLMGEIVERLADVVVVTDDNPRYEEPEKIREEILKACPKAKEIADRAEAIQWAVENLQVGDVLLVAGKGHETGQIVGEKVYDFDDVEEVKKAIEKVSL